MSLTNQVNEKLGIHDSETCTLGEGGQPCEMCKWVSRCILHPDREAKLDATDIRVCGECFKSYQAERREKQGLENRPFYQSLLNARHGLRAA